MKQTEFVVRRFVNRNGTTSWRVAGWLHGVRIRKNLPTREEAAAEKAALEIKAVQAESGLRPALTCLSDEQLREAESLFRAVTERTRGLTFYVTYALSNYRDPEHEKSLEEAARIYLALRSIEENHGRLSHRQFTSFRCELRALTTHFPKANVCALTPAKLVAFFQRGNVGKKSFNNRRGLVGPFLKYCLLQGWIAVNPTEKVPHYRGLGHRRGSAVTLTAARCAEIMEWCETNHDGKLVPFAALSWITDQDATAPDNCASDAGGKVDRSEARSTLPRRYNRGARAVTRCTSLRVAAAPPRRCSIRLT